MTMHEITDAKKAIRKEAKERLGLVSDRAGKERRITDRAKTAAEAANTIAVYLSFGNEVSTDELIKVLLSQNKKIFVPVIMNNNEMVFTRIYPDTGYKKNAYGIREPEITEITEGLDLIFLPLVAFDEQNHRLGRGKGYYDRFLADKSCLKIGLAFKEQLFPTLPLDPHDIPLDEVIYE